VPSFPGIKFMNLTADERGCTQMEFKKGKDSKLLPICVYPRSSAVEFFTASGPRNECVEFSV
jgi:hypothetical protein